MHKCSRRAALKGLGLAAAPFIVPARVFGDEAPSNRIAVGIIGTGRQSHQINIPQFLNSPHAQVVALCDVDSWRLETVKAQVETHYAAQTGQAYSGCAVYRDFRELIAREDVDAVMISGPDHWHVPMGIAAAKAGKHFSVEKPLSTCIAHGRLLCETATRHGVVTRTDSEFRSLPEMWRGVECVRNRRIGKLTNMKVCVPGDSAPVGMPAEMPVPENLDYDMWLGPAFQKPYTEQRVHPAKDLKGRPGWLRISDYTNGMVSNWGSHLNDIAQWAHGTDRGGPVTVEGTGTFSEGLWDTIVEFQLHYAYADGVTLDYEMGKSAGIEFTGDEGWLRAMYGGEVTASDPSILRPEKAPGDIDLSATLTDKEDFLQAIRGGAETLEPVEVGHRTVSLCQIGLIAIQLGRKLEWAPERERFINDDEANGRLDRPVRGDWLKT
ncbi:MAG TPA: Gfo/Idh/MocA family oxidoreductase [Candidatus Hydrogenedentes bacterium]|nr:Gfo/Idh/MocA family oxidoreductase [Candidatus Hydrogenedentota bacterium]